MQPLVPRAEHHLRFRHRRRRKERIFLILIAPRNLPRLQVRAHKNKIIIPHKRPPARQRRRPGNVRSGIDRMDRLPIRRRNHVNNRIAAPEHHLILQHRRRPVDVIIRLIAPDLCPRHRVHAMQDIIVTADKDPRVLFPGLPVIIHAPRNLPPGLVLPHHLPAPLVDGVQMHIRRPGIHPPLPDTGRGFHRSARGKGPAELPVCQRQAIYLLIVRADINLPALNRRRGFHRRPRLIFPQQPQPLRQRCRRHPRQRRVPPVHRPFGIL
ncbi:MAG: hypothetical protein BWY71_01608 [Planctomycetes bacterium ADurb.Bin412]|nr:MAG: hypothetical protein BWY71_01608 [Planctomycetes bacterium ADurb.Bin412]